MEIHAVTNKYAVDNGVSLGVVVRRIEAFALAADRVVCFNSMFHGRVMLRAYYDCGMAYELDQKPWVCAMQQSADVVRTRLQGNGRWAWPKQSVAFQHFTGRELIPDADPIARGRQMANAAREIFYGIIRSGKVIT